MKKGVSLIEILVASLVLVIVIGSGLMLYTRHVQLADSNSKRNQAMLILEDYLERIRFTKNSVLISSTDNNALVSGHTTIATAHKNTVDGIEYLTHFTYKPVEFSTATTPAKPCLVDEITATISWKSNSSIPSPDNSFSITTRKGNL